MDNAEKFFNRPSEVEKKYVYEIYDKIAPHFSSTRYKPWPQIKIFLEKIQEGSLVADIGKKNKIKWKLKKLKKNFLIFSKI